MSIHVASDFPEQVLKQKNQAIFNFFNLNTIWWIKNSFSYGSMILRGKNINFPDGRVLSRFLNIKQKRGPSFTKRFLNSEISKNKRHFFIGLNKEDTKKLSLVCGIKIKYLGAYNPPYVKGIEFPLEERQRIIKKIKTFKPDFIWVCVGSPKQEILANQLFIKHKCVYFNVGAAIDFLLEKKKEAPRIFRKIGLEWLYRLITDPKTTRKKAWRSFVALKHINKIKIK